MDINIENSMLVEKDLLFLILVISFFIDKRNDKFANNRNHFMEPKQVLIVHDDLGVSYLLKKILESTEAEYTIANTFDHVESLLENYVYEMVITDVTIDGNFTGEYLDFLRRCLPQACVIVVSEMNQEDVKKEVLPQGIQAYIDFPVAIDNFQQVINSYL